MEKKTISVHALTVHIYTIAIIALILLLGIVGLKYLHLKLAMHGFTQSTIWMNSQNRPTGQVSDYGVIIGETVGQNPSIDLQGYVSTLSKELNRDIVVMDRNQKILADTVSANRQTAYTYDSNNEIKKTIADGATRSFEEKSQDYPTGILEIVVPMKNSKGEIAGVVLISNSQVK